jgi:magnesium chelatase accessory protein
MDWARDGADWPHREASRFVDCRPHRWHVQVMGQGPVLLLLHGAGGATQSWRRLMPLLARDWTVVAPDMPGQGFTRMGSRWRSGLDPTAEDIAALLAQEGWIPAGTHRPFRRRGGRAPARRDPARAATRRGRDQRGARLFQGPGRVPVSDDGQDHGAEPAHAGHGLALLGRRGQGGRAAGDHRVRKSMPRGCGLYARLVRDRDHVDGTLTMMAQWKLDGLIARMPRIETPVLLLVGERDGTVPAEVSRDAAARLPAAEVVSLGPLGHLAHEEAPETVMNAMAGFLSDTVKPDVPAGT